MKDNRLEQEERALQARQRAQLRHWLDDAELTVPATTERILSALPPRQSHSSQISSLPVEREYVARRGVALTPTPARVPLLNFWQKVGSIAAVILIIFGSFNLFGRLIAWHSLQATLLASSTVATARKITNQSLATAVPTVPFDAWHDVLVTGSSAAEKSLILNYDVHSLSYQRLPLASSWPVSVDGVSRNGSNFLYHVNDKTGQTLFWTHIPLASQGYFLALKHAGNAVWMPDNRSVLVAKADGGILQVDTQNGASQLLLPTLKVAQLAFYRAPYLYFTSMGSLLENALYRVNITTPAQPQQITRQSPFTTFWLSPDGSTVYYKNNGTTGVFSVHSDGTNEQVLAQDGTPVGYAADNALMLMRQNSSGQFQLMKVNADEGSLQTVFADVAPGATALCDQAQNASSSSICDQSIALAPLGGGLVCAAMYADGTTKLWSINLKTGQRSQLPLPANSPGLTLSLVGWDAMN